MINPTRIRCSVTRSAIRKFHDKSRSFSTKKMSFHEQSAKSGLKGEHTFIKSHSVDFKGLCWNQLINKEWINEEEHVEGMEMLLRPVRDLSLVSGFQMGIIETVIMQYLCSTEARINFEQNLEYNQGVKFIGPEDSFGIEDESFDERHENNQLFCVGFFVINGPGTNNIYHKVFIRKVSDQFIGFSQVESFPKRLKRTLQGFGGWVRELGWGSKDDFELILSIENSLDIQDDSRTQNKSRFEIVLKPLSSSDSSMVITANELLNTGKTRKLHPPTSAMSNNSFGFGFVPFCLGTVSFLTINNRSIVFFSQSPFLELLNDTKTRSAVLCTNKDNYPAKLTPHHCSLMLKSNQRLVNVVKAMYWSPLWFASQSINNREWDKAIKAAMNCIPKAKSTRHKINFIDLFGEGECFLVEMAKKLLNDASSHTSLQDCASATKIEEKAQISYGEVPESSFQIESMYNVDYSQIPEESIVLPPSESFIKPKSSAKNIHSLSDTEVEELKTSSNNEVLSHEYTSHESGDRNLTIQESESKSYYETRIYNDQVHFSIFGPPIVPTCTSFDLIVYAYTRTNRDDVLELVKEHSYATEERGICYDPTSIQRGNLITARIQLPTSRFVIQGDPQQQIRWNGAPEQCLFDVMWLNNPDPDGWSENADGVCIEECLEEGIMVGWTVRGCVDLVSGWSCSRLWFTLEISACNIGDSFEIPNGGLVRSLMEKTELESQIQWIKPCQWRVWEGDVEIIRQLGEGHFGSVYHCKYNGQDIVLKKVRSDSLIDAEHLKNETEILSRIPETPNLVKYLGLCLSKKEEEECDFMESRDCSTIGDYSLMMTYYSGGNLQSLLESQDLRKYGWNQVEMDPKRLILDCSRGLSVLHDHHVLHRDLATRNCLLSQNTGGSCVLSDFGLSVVRPSNCLENTLFESKHDQQFPIHILAPEILKNKVFSSKSDVFSLGLVMYQTLTFDTTFDRLDAMKTRDKFLSGDESIGSLQTEMRDLIVQCWSEDVGLRPSAKQLTRRLERICSSS